MHTSVVSKREFRGSGLTRCGQRGAAYVGADDVAERIAGAVAGAAQRPSLTYVYDGDLDWHGHRAGVDSQRWRAQLRDIDEDVQELRDELPDDVRLLVVADHGMVDSTKDTRIDVDEHPELRDGVDPARWRGPVPARLLPRRRRRRRGGHLARRTRRPGHRAHPRRGDRARLVRRRSTPHVRLRLGDVVVAAHDNWALISSVDFKYEMTLIGLHGSLTPREMNIPILVG